MSKQIKTIGYRNAIYTGEINTNGENNTNGSVNGLGIIVDDAYLTCLSNWIPEGLPMLDGSNDHPKAVGPTVALFPQR